MGVYRTHTHLWWTWQCSELLAEDLADSCQHKDKHKQSAASQGDLWVVVSNAGLVPRFASDIAL